MSLTVCFELGDKDLEHFREAMAKATQVAQTSPPQAIITSARALLGKLDGRDIPAFVRTRLDQLGTMVAMTEDEEWALPEEDRSHVLSALAYFADPQDLIPDEVPGLGFLDDAIMVELVLEALQSEMDAYQEFCQFRDQEAARHGGSVNREDWLAAKRQELHERMRARRKERNLGGDRPVRFSFW